ncbi:Nif3-like dinuclear metal center hexameric protein [bacterium]|nr:Nif3-like dinuclear metal center hexameric protein [bacterium]
MILKDIINKLNNLYPESLKQSYDNVGLMVGRTTKDIKTVLLALDLTRDVMDEAINLKVDLIITHHPILYYPLSLIDTDKDPGSIVRDLIKYDISNYSLHTNFDQVKMNDYLADMIGIKNKEILSEKENLGVYGDIEPVNIQDFINDLKNILKFESCEYYGAQDLKVKKVGIIGGSGASRIYQAKEKDLDLFITGDVSYSKAIESKRLNLNVLDVGHEIEALFMDVIEADLLSLDKSFKIYKSQTRVIQYKRY